MTYFPEVSLEQTRAMLAEMDRRYLDAGHGLHAVHQHRWMVAAARRRPSRPPRSTSGRG